MFELLTGQLPFPGDDPLQVMYRQVHEQPPIPHVLNPAVPAALSAALLRALDKEPSRRHAGAQQMWDALDHAKDAAEPAASTTEIRHLRSVARFTPDLRRVRPLATSLVAAAVMLMAGVLGLSAFSRGGSISSTMTPVATTLASPWLGAVHRRTATALATMPSMIVGAEVGSAATAVPTSTPVTAEAPTPTPTPAPTSPAPTPTPQTGIVTGSIIRNDAPEQPAPQPTATPQPTEQPSTAAPSAPSAPPATTDQPSSPPPKDPKDPKDSKGPPPKDPKDSKDSKDSKPPKPPKDAKAPPKAPKDPPSSHKPPKGH